MGTDFTAHQGALAFASRGFPIFPIYGVVERDGKLQCACGDAKCNGNNRGKHPLRGSRGFKDAACDLDQIKSWDPSYNYGIATGSLLVIDIDPRSGGDREWEKLYRKNYLVHTWEVITGGGGRHIIFANPTGVRCSKFANGIEAKAHGGYIVGVGSRHISGKFYHWAPQCSPKEAQLMDPPQWVLDEIGKTQQPGERLPPETWTILRG
jgi:hypothetical protein